MRPARAVVRRARVQHNRCLPGGAKPWEHRGSGALIGELAFAMAARQGLKTRKMSQQLWARSVSLPASKDMAIVATCMIAREIDTLDRIRPIKRRLLTNREAANPEAVFELID